jgi:hypothetical protein
MRRYRLAGAALVAGLASAILFGAPASAAPANPGVVARKIVPPNMVAGAQPVMATRISITPDSVTSNAPSPVTLTGHVWGWKGNPLPGKKVSFAILDGPNRGASLKPSSNSDGSAWSVQLSSTKPGVDVVQATYSDGLELHKSNRTFVEWHTGPPAAALRSPAALQIGPDCFQPAVSAVRASDTMKSATPKNAKANSTPAAETGTITVTGTDFNPFTAVLITFDAGPGGKPQSFPAQTDGFGVFSRDIQVTEPAEGTHLIRADDFRQREAQATYRLPCSQGNIALNPPIGPPGFVTTVVGRDFPPNSQITLLNWLKPDLLSPFPKGSISTDAQGNFQFSVMILYHDELGPRALRAIVQDAVANEGNALIQADAPFFVTPGRAQPDALVLRR